MIKRLLLLFILFTATACSGLYSNVQNYGLFDKSQKSITVPPGGSSLNGYIKRELYGHGWILKVDTGAEKIEGVFGAGAVNKNVDLNKYTTYKTKYRLEMASRQEDMCVSFTRMTPLFSYNLSIIDNTSGDEVLVIDGYDCQDNIIETFQDALDKSSLQEYEQLAE